MCAYSGDQSNTKKYKNEREQACCNALGLGAIMEAWKFCFHCMKKLWKRVDICADFDGKCF